MWPLNQQDLRSSGVPPMAPKLFLHRMLAMPEKWFTATFHKYMFLYRISLTVPNSPTKLESKCGPHGSMKSSDVHKIAQLERAEWGPLMCLVALEFLTAQLPLPFLKLHFFGLRYLLNNWSFKWNSVGPWIVVNMWSCSGQSVFMGRKGRERESLGNSMHSPKNAVPNPLA